MIVVVFLFLLLLLLLLLLLPPLFGGTADDDGDARTSTTLTAVKVASLDGKHDARLNDGAMMPSVDGRRMKSGRWWMMHDEDDGDVLQCDDWDDGLGRTDWGNRAETECRACSPDGTELWTALFYFVL